MHLTVFLRGRREHLLIRDGTAGRSLHTAQPQAAA